MYVYLYVCVYYVRVYVKYVSVYICMYAFMCVLVMCLLFTTTLLTYSFNKQQLHPIIMIISICISVSINI